MELEIIEQIKALNEALDRQYGAFNAYKKKDWRKFFRKVGKTYFVEDLTKDELGQVKKEGGVLSIDGSSNRLGGAYPHFVTLFRGAGVFTEESKNIITKTDAYIPLLDHSMDSSPEESRREQDRILAKVELETALKALKEKNPRFLFMDGSFIRFAILQQTLWEELKSRVLEKDIILVGIIEDIKTAVLFEKLSETTRMNPFYDREALFNQLEYKEALEIHGLKEGKESYGLYSAFFRSSQSPTVIAVDLLGEQKNQMAQVLSLVLSLTHPKGRGVPFLIDYADQASRITHKMIEELLSLYLEPAYYEKLFHCQRSKRDF